MIVFAIDPGSILSAYVIYDTERATIREKGKLTNNEVKNVLARSGLKPAIEYPKPRGQPMWTQLVDTIMWIGRFCEASAFKNFYPIDRKDVKMVLCGTVKAKDSNVRAAVISLFPDTGGGKIGQIGVKKDPGPLFGVSKDIWSALAVALTHSIQQGVPPTAAHKRSMGGEPMAPLPF